ncbi:S8 family serine peptidase [Terriglobus sp. TAA 43]|uniref:S8 family serine peptidase n=1 Tax=Terriglobus sp. TAA 43 TaxID=278961 RepID=UPI000645FE0D|nr:S8 family serine peptidase [Terriglobus sp. TAA 43]
MVTRVARLLVKASVPAVGAAFAAGALPFEMTPLFPEETSPAGFGLTEAPRWHIAKLAADTDVASAWNMCHQIRTGGMGLAANTVDFAEPDFQQQWDFGVPAESNQAAMAAAAPRVCDKPVDPATDPNGYSKPDPYTWRWFQADAYAGFDTARTHIDTGALGNTLERVTIAHLDTGYRKDHAVLPEFLDTTKGRSFVKNDTDPNSAVDPGITGFGNNPGHGTGTLSLLAGNVFDATKFGDVRGLVGAAPFARIIPVRVANSVVEFANSSIAQGIQYAIDSNVDVLSMSMGGIPSQAWVDVVNKAYDAGITLVTAAGNNYGPGGVRVPKFIVWPARFKRVIAACGVMSNGKPWADFADLKLMGGCYGPDSKMDTAMAAYTPNVPWAVYDCPALVDFDGRGTSAATPQVAAAAACYIQANLAGLRAYDGADRWKRVESVRKALFDSATKLDQKHFGQGALRAIDAMNQPLANPAGLVAQPRDSVAVPFLGPIFGALFGIAPDPTAESMLHLEAAQLISTQPEIQKILVDADVDPDGAVPPAVRSQVIDAIIASPAASTALKQALAHGGGNAGGQGGKGEGGAVVVGSKVVPKIDPLKETPGETLEPTLPLYRCLRVFAFDPALGLRLDSQALNQTILQLPWERDLKPGPVGEYVEIVDVDPATGACYMPVDLNHPHILASDGLAPSEALPQFHQQMVYAVSMTTIGRFERALGRTALWAPHLQTVAGEVDQVQRNYVQRLRIYPHALREANAYYSPDKKSLLFGYFQANLTNAGDNLPGGVIFNCLSHDVVAHETTHALLDGLHPYYQIQSNPDMAAFHEAFADTVALFQHFSIPEALRFTIAKTRGDLSTANLLADLAQQFGQAMDGSRALRSGLGTKPTPSDYVNATEPHARGAVLLAAIFEAFVNLYQARSYDLQRLATGGTGVLPPGDIPYDLVTRLSVEAAQTASRVLTACIRALDYCPPVDLTFGDYLRALVTADLDIEPQAGVNARVAFISAFRARGIYPSGVRSLSEESLCWQPPNFVVPRGQLGGLLKCLSLSWNLATDRRKSHDASEHNGFVLWNFLHEMDTQDAIALGRDLGVYIVPAPGMPKEIPLRPDGYPKIEIHSVRPARRIGSNGQQATDLVIEMVQRYVEVDAVTKTQTTLRGGCTVLIDLENEQIRYVIRKRVDNLSRMADMKAFTMAASDSGSPYFLASEYSEPFAMLHRGC